MSITQAFVPNTFSPAPTAFAELLEQYIERTACGRVSGLHVEYDGNSVVLQGRCRTQHAKQLVLQAALDWSEGVVGLDNRLVVS